MEKQIETRYEHIYTDVMNPLDDYAGYRFDCDKDGKLLAVVSESAKESFHKLKTGEIGGYEYKGIQSYMIIVDAIDALEN